jgi:hypothetical protein
VFKVPHGAVNVSFATGAFAPDDLHNWDNRSLEDEAVALAAKSDVTVVVLGDSMTTCGEWKDRDSLDVPGTQLSLLRRVSQTATTTVVVLLNGRPTTFGEFDPDGSRTLDQVSSMLVAGAQVRKVLWRSPT